MRLFIILSLIIHAASLSYFMWHKQQDKKNVVPPMSTMVQIVSSPEEYELEEEPEPLRDEIQKKTAKKIKKKERLLKRPAQTVSRKGPSKEELEYGQKLQVFIEKNRFYPKPALRLKQQGTVVISLTILKDGSFSSVKLIEKSDHTVLDKAAISFLKDLKEFEPLPRKDKLQQEYIIPIFYKIGH